MVFLKPALKQYTSSSFWERYSPC